MKRVAKFKGDDPKFLRLLALLEDEDVDNDVREDAERQVMEAVLDFGVWIGHGDLLTVKMVQEARLLMKGSATAFGRLEFISGPFRLQLLHMKMKKVSVDFSSGMRQEINFEDVLSLSWSASLARVKVSNKSKDIKKNDSTFELHDQFISAVQESYFVNMYDNYIKCHPLALEDIKSSDDVVEFIHDMLASYNIQLYFDPDHELKEEEEFDDLYVYCQVSNIFAMHFFKKLVL